MTETDARRLKADALLAFTEAKQRLALLHAQANKWGQDLVNLGSVLRGNPHNISAESCREALDYSKLTKLLADLQQARTEAQKTEAKARELGCQTT